SHPAPWFVPDQVSRLERREREVEVPVGSDGAKNPTPEGLPDHRRIEQHSTFRRGEDVDPSRDRFSDRRRERIGALRPFRDGCGELLDEQGVPTRDLDESPDRWDEIRIGSERRGRDRGGVGIAEWFERDRGVREKTASPCRPCVEKLRPCEREEHDRYVANVRAQ